LEHVLDRESTFIGTCQHILGKSGIWPLMYDGCIPNHNTDLEILKAGFSDVDQKRVCFNTKGVFNLIARQVMGVATK